MDLLLLCIGIISAVFMLFIVFSDELKMVEKIVGSFIFTMITIGCFASVLLAGYYIEKQVHLVYHDHWVEENVVVENNIRTETQISRCRVIFDVDLPFTAFYGVEYSRDFEGTCADLTEEDKATIAEMVENYKV